MASQLEIKPPEVGIYLDESPQMGKLTVDFLTHLSYANPISNILRKEAPLGERV